MDISFVTNRDTSVEIETKHTLKRLNILYNQVIFYRKDNNKTQGTTDNQQLKTKEDRFFAIANGIVQHNILMFLGDSIVDFPGMAQADSDNFNASAVDSQAHDKFSKFGTEFIILPNPTYSVWRKNCDSVSKISDNTSCK